MIVSYITQQMPCFVGKIRGINQLVMGGADGGYCFLFGGELSPVMKTDGISQLVLGATECRCSVFERNQAPLYSFCHIADFDGPRIGQVR